MRTTASRSARVAKRQPMSTGVRVQPVPGPEPLDRVRVDLRVAAAEPPPNVERVRVVVDHERRAAAAYDAVELGAAPARSPGPKK